MFNVGGPELLVILLLALLVLGPTRLPDAARQVGKMMGEVRKLSNGFQSEVKNAFNEVDSPGPTTPQVPVTSATTAAEPPAAKQAAARGQRAEARAKAPAAARATKAPAKKRSAPLKAARPAKPASE